MPTHSRMNVCLMQVALQTRSVTEAVTTALFQVTAVHRHASCALVAVHLAYICCRHAVEWTAPAKKACTAHEMRVVVLELCAPQGN